MYDYTRLIFGIFLTVIVVLIYIYVNSGSKITTVNIGDACNGTTLKCGNNASCSSGFCKLQTGSRCKLNSDCLSGVCAGGLYCKETLDIGTLFNPPSSTDGCIFGLEPDVTNTICLRQENTECYYDQECSSKFCDKFNGFTGTCRVLPGLGDQCVDSCKSGLQCSLGYCQNKGITTGDLQSSCKFSSCTTGICRSEICMGTKTQKIGLICSSSDDCEFGTCVKGYCNFIPNDYTVCPSGYFGKNCEPKPGSVWYTDFSSTVCKTSNSYNLRIFKEEFGVYFDAPVDNNPVNVFSSDFKICVQYPEYYKIYDPKFNLVNTVQLKKGESVMNDMNTIYDSEKISGVPFNPPGLTNFYKSDNYYSIKTTTSPPGLILYISSNRNNASSIEMVNSKTLPYYSRYKVFPNFGVLLGFGNTVKIHNIYTENILEIPIPNPVVLDSAYYYNTTSGYYIAILVDSGDFARLYFKTTKTPDFIEIPGKFSKTTRITYLTNYLYILCNYICK